MRNQYFLKDKKALIYDSVSVSGSGYMPKTYYVPRTPAPIWCYARQLSQDTVFQAAAYGEDESRYFVFNQGTVAELYDLILYREKWYQITRVDTEDDYNRDVFVYVKDAPRGSIPSADSLKPYGWQTGDDD